MIDLIQIKQKKRVQHKPNKTKIVTVVLIPHEKIGHNITEIKIILYTVVDT